MAMAATKPAPTAARMGATSSSSRTAMPAAASSTAAWTARRPTPQAAQEGMQATCNRAQGRAAVQPGTREAGGGLLPDLHSADSIANRTALTVHLLLYEESLQRLFTCCVSARDGRHLPFCRTPVPNDDATSLAMVQKRIDVGDAVAMVWDQSMRTMNLGGRTTMAMVLGRIK